jgi:hypothetical protein
MSSTHNGGSSVEHATALEHEVETIRLHIGDLVDELDHRRHELFNLRGQVRRHPVRLVLAAALVAGALAGGIALAVRARHRRRSFSGRVQRFREALGRARQHPDRIAKDSPSVARKIAAAGGTSIASVLGKQLATKMFAAPAAAAGK